MCTALRSSAFQLLPLKSSAFRSRKKNRLLELPFCRYGSYEICNDPYLSGNRLSLIDRGFVFALAHVRGGGEMGRHWYEDGKYLHKKNTFTDFIACAEYLVKEKYTSPAHLCIEVC